MSTSDNSNNNNNSSHTKNDDTTISTTKTQQQESDPKQQQQEQQDRFLLSKAESEVMEMLDDLIEEDDEHPTLGVIRLDYDYPTAPGDIDDPKSFNYPVIYRAVPGFTFQMAQCGILSDDVKDELRDAVQFLIHDKHCKAITGDCGFMMWFQDYIRELAPTVPVFMSSLMQLPTISAALCKEHDKVIVMTANVNSLRPMKTLINAVTGSLEEHMHFVYVGCEDVKHFGYEVEHGLQVNTKLAEPGILQRAKDAIEQYPNARALLLECTELPPYSDALRSTTGLPVYDSITCCDFVMNSFLDNERFGAERWYKPWNGIQESYRLDKYLTQQQRRKLISKPVMTDEHAMDMIMNELQQTKLVDEIQKMGMDINIHDAAHAIAHQIEMKEISNKMKKVISTKEFMDQYYKSHHDHDEQQQQQQVNAKQNNNKKSHHDKKKKKKKKPFKRARDFFATHFWTTTTTG